ncbi:MAG: hypothetical protein ABEJ88_05105 [Halobacterium sp.]
MTDDDIAARLRAVERAVTDGDAPLEDLEDAAEVHERLDNLAADLAAAVERLDAVEATVQSLHGYVGELEHVNERVERRADAARAAVERFDAERAPDRNSTAAGTTARPDPADGSEPSPGRPVEDALEDVDSDLSGTDAGEYSRPEGESDPAGSLLDRVRDSL